MRNGLLLGIAVLPACISTEPARSVEATWTIERLEQGEVGCPADWATAQLVTTSAANPGLRSVSQFPCGAGRGFSASLPAEGDYVSSVEFLDADGAVVATSIPQALDIGPFSAMYESTVYLDAGYVSLTWEHVPSSAEVCDTTSTFNPFLAVVLALDGPQDTSVWFHCYSDQGTTPALPAGTYKAAVTHSFSRQELPDIVVEAPNRVTQLPHLVL